MRFAVHSAIILRYIVLKSAIRKRKTRKSPRKSPSKNPIHHCTDVELAAVVELAAELAAANALSTEAGDDASFQFEPCGTTVLFPTSEPAVDT